MIDWSKAAIQREGCVCFSKDSRDGAAPALPGSRRLGLEVVPVQGNRDETVVVEYSA